MSKALLARALQLCRPFRKAIVAAIVLALLRTAVELAVPLVYRFVIDVAIPKGSVTIVLSGAVAYTLLSIAAAALGAGYTYFLTRAGLNVVLSLRSRLVDAVLRWPLSQWDDVSTGQVQARLVSDVQTLQSALTDTLPSLVRNALILPTTLAAVLMLNWQLAMPCIILIPAYILAARYCGLWNRTAWQRVAEKRETFLKVLQDSFQGVRVIKAVASEASHTEWVARFDRGLAAAYLSAAAVGTIYAVSVAAVSVLPAGVILGWGGLLVARGLTSVGTIVAAATYAHQLFTALSVIPRLYVQSKQLGVFLRRSFEYLDIPAEEGGTARPNLRRNCDVVFSNVYLAYKGRVALKGISLRVSTGKTVAIVGPSGSGKTSVAMLILGLYRPYHGSITVGGVDLVDCDLAWLRRHVGFVAQDPFLFTGTIYENISYSKPGATLQEVIQAAKAAHIHEFIASLPQGYDTPCGERGVQLSAGQRQRIVIARTLLQDPALLILDEATSGLDAKTEAEVTETLGKLMKGRTTIVISHRPSAIVAADYVYVLVDGSVAEEGTLADLHTRSLLFREFMPAEVS